MLCENLNDYALYCYINCSDTQYLLWGSEWLHSEWSALSTIFMFTHSAKSKKA
ncbi:Uncharacterised protein [Candidatus Venteria ishoeyi]|uniref:Uncharacterized protein n=1 Tax=Candidatus Venteria ishoeyi TaxID=1899563 RepID=A0A1H6FH73_9GAMM|nr:Uncharacterised protein [Candidatus Venteria ishoeyi]